MNVRTEIKNVRASFKAVGDAPAGTFEAIVSVFGNVDLGGDRVMPGAFAKTLGEWQASGDPIPVIWSHEWDDPESHIGYVEQAEERAEGLYVKARLDVDNNPRAAYVARLLKERRVREFSFGYFATGWKTVEDSQYGTVRELTEIDLFEVGPTLLGMNPETVLLEAASRLGKPGRKVEDSEVEILKQARNLIDAVIGEESDEDPSEDPDMPDEPDVMGGKTATDVADVTETITVTADITDPAPADTDGSSDTPTTIDTERLLGLLARPRYTEE